MISKALAETVPLSNQNSCLHIYIQALEALWKSVIFISSSVNEIMDGWMDFSLELAKKKKELFFKNFRFFLFE